MSTLSSLVASGAIASALVSVAGALTAVLAKYKNRESQLTERRQAVDATSITARLLAELQTEQERLLVVMAQISEIKRYQIEDKELLERIKTEVQLIRSDANRSTDSSEPPSRKANDA